MPSRPEAMSLATRSLAVIVVIQSLLLSACGSAGPELTPEQRDAALLREDYSSSSPTNAMTVLARGGITVYDSSGTKVSQTAKAAGAMAVTESQAQSMARDLADRAGYRGDQLDALANVDPGYIPPSYLLAGYASAGDTYGARLSKALLADQDLSRPQDVLFPTITLVLFVSDAAQQWSRAGQSATGGVSAQGVSGASLFAMPSAFDPCGALATFLGNTLNTLADKIVNAVSPTNVPILKAVIGFAVKTLLVQGIKILGNAITGIPFIAAVRRVLGIVGIMASIVSSLRNWSVKVTASPSSDMHYAVGDATANGRLTATVDDRGGDLFSAAVRNCADLIKVDLPHAGAPGSQVEWRISRGIPGDATIAPGSPDRVVDKSNTATLQFAMSHESENAHLHGELHDDHAIAATVTIRRADTAEVTRVINELLAGGLGPVIKPFISGIVSSITGELTKLIDPSSAGVIRVSYHTEPNASPTPPSPSSSPSTTPSPVELRNSCQLLTLADVDNVLGASPKQQYFPPQTPGAGNACLYGPTTIDWKIAWSLVGLSVLPPPNWGPLTRNMTPISGIGDEAYFHDGPSDLSGQLAVRKGTTLMELTISLGSGSARQVLIELAQIAIGRV
jgi:hypothetical protein